MLLSTSSGRLPSMVSNCDRRRFWCIWFTSRRDWWLFQFSCHWLGALILLSAFLVLVSLLPCISRTSNYYSGLRHGFGTITGPIRHIRSSTGALTSTSPFWCTTLRKYTSMRSNVERGSTPPHILPHSRSPNFVCSNVSEVFVLQCWAWVCPPTYFATFACTSFYCSFDFILGSTPPFVCARFISFTLCTALLGVLV